MQLTYALEGYWLSRRRELSPHTIADYEVTFKRLVEFFGAEREFESLKAADIDRFLNDLRSRLGLGAKTIRNAWTALSSLWTWAEAREDVRHALRGKVQRPQYRRPQIEPYTAEEVRGILKACEIMAAWDNRHNRHVAGGRPTAVRDRAMILMMVDCGLRVSELCDLKIRDYVAKRGQVTILHGKGDKQRTVTIAATARQALWRYLKTRPEAQPDEPLFVSRTGQRMDRSGVRAIVKRAGDRAGIKHAGPHKFRHTFAINFLRNGGRELALQDILGHEKLDTVRIYVRLAATDLEREQMSASPADRWGL